MHLNHQPHSLVKSLVSSGSALTSLFSQHRNTEAIVPLNPSPARSKTGAILARLRLMDRWLLALIIIFALTLPLVEVRIYAIDEIEYFSYLHTFYFDHDFDLTDEYMAYKTMYKHNENTWNSLKHDFLDNNREKETDLPQNVGPIGSAIMWTPYYGLAHLYALVGHALTKSAALKPNGYTKPYIAAACYGSAINAFIGLILIYLICRDLFARSIAFVATLSILFATPVAFYTYFSAGFSHANSLFAAAIFIFCWWKTLGKRTWKGWLLLGLAAGLMAIVREQDGLFALLPACESLWRYYQYLRPKDWASFKKLAWGNLLFGGAAFIVFIPQLLTYKGINGYYGPSNTVVKKLHYDAPWATGINSDQIANKYTGFLHYWNPGETVLFSPAHGVFFWSPILLLATIGFYFLWRKQVWLGFAAVLAFLLEVYISGAFQTWSQMGSFGSRRFIVLTVFFVLGFAALLDWLREKQMHWYIILFGCAILVAWNTGLLMNWAFTWLGPQKGLRQGLDWATLPRDQLNVYLNINAKIHDYLTNPQQFENQ